MRKKPFSGSCCEDTQNIVVFLRKEKKEPNSAQVFAHVASDRCVLLSGPEHGGHLNTLIRELTACSPPPATPATVAYVKLQLITQANNSFACRR